MHPWRKAANLLNRLPYRILAILLATVLVGIVWAITKLFPAADRQTIAVIGAFAIAGLFAFSIGGNRRG